MMRFWLGFGTLAAGLVAFSAGVQGCAGETEDTAPLPNPTTSTTTSAGGSAAAGGSGGFTLGGSGGTGGALGGGGSGGSACGDTELCDGVDNDCDDEIDEDCPCVEGQTQDCYSGDTALIDHGVCAWGTQTCDINGVWGACADEILPSDETCNSLDDDCDDAIDEELDDVVCGVGICQVTVPACLDGEPVPCVPGQAQPPEDCEGTDDDCDGSVDEDCPCIEGELGPCYTGSSATRNVGECHDGEHECDSSGEWGTCTGDQLPVAELCNSLDDDCDGVDDDGNPEGGGPCDGDDSDLCLEGFVQCIDGALSCDDPVEDHDLDLCNNSTYDDCNTSTADGADDPAIGQPCDGTDTDKCTEGTYTGCAGGVLQCSDPAGENDLDLCNGSTQDDCDATTADGSQDPSLGQPCDGADVDLCAEGNFSGCSNGSLVCSDPNGESYDLCNGSTNDDCNTATADGYNDPALGQPCDGADSDKCIEGSYTGCANGTLQCDDPPTEHDLDLCNGNTSDDCDATTPDGSQDPQLGQPCDGTDVDLCNEGSYTGCTNGSLVCSDPNGATPDVCNGSTDDDCNAATADGYNDPALGQPCDGADSDKCTEGSYTGCVNGVLVCSDPVGENDLDLCNGNTNDDCDATTPDGYNDPALGGACDGADSDACPDGSYTGCTNGNLVCDDPGGAAYDLCNNNTNDDCDPGTADGYNDPLLGQSCDGPDLGKCAEGEYTSCVGGVLQCDDATGDDFDYCNSSTNDDCDTATADGSNDPALGTACDGADSDKCAEGSFTSCVGGVLQCNDPATEHDLDLCNGNTNDDCDVTTPDGSQDPLLGDACDGTDVDKCAEGTYTGCSAGNLICNDPNGATPDVCNNDTTDDCDPATADGYNDPLLGASCDGPDVGKCAEGQYTSCVSGVLQCDDTTGDDFDYCNGNTNDDCDAATQDGVNDPSLNQPCDGADSDKCAEGTFTSCVGGVLQCNDPATEHDLDLCNGNTNDDCDVTTADGSQDPLLNSPCDGTDLDLCVEGTYTGCSGGSLVCSDPNVESYDLCNGNTNDDCNAGTADGYNDPLIGQTCDGDDSDLCREGHYTGCVGGVMQCDDATGDSLDLCNGNTNDDCNSATLDGSQDPAIGQPCDGTDLDLCAEGTYTGCVSGGLVCNDPNGATYDLCNGNTNDDCNTSTADGYNDPLLGQPCDGLDSDLCAEGIYTGCVGGVLQCDDPAGEHDLDLCNNNTNDDCNPNTADGSQDPLLGDDCDGADSDQCLEGVYYGCTSGVLQCSDPPSEHDVEICNAVDDDCDGTNNEDNPGGGVACDTGLLGPCAVGETNCVGTALECTQLTFAEAEICDNSIDEDCTGVADDGATCWCDPMNPSAVCGAGFRCRPGANAPEDPAVTPPICEAAGTAGQYDYCGSCGPTHLCINIDGLMGNDVSTICSGWCRVGGTDCTGGDVCYGLSTPLYVGTQQYGVCFAAGPDYVPDAFGCEPSFYAGADGCDCGCGVFDPDCANQLKATCAYCNFPGSCAEADAQCATSCTAANCWLDSADNSTCSGTP